MKTPGFVSLVARTVLCALALMTAAAAANEDRRANYFPNTEALGADEMRVIALGTGTPNFRHSQASASWLIELGNGDRFLFDVGTGSLPTSRRWKSPTRRRW